MKTELETLALEVWCLSSKEASPIYDLVQVRRDICTVFHHDMYHQWTARVISIVVKAVRVSLKATLLVVIDEPIGNSGAATSKGIRAGRGLSGVLRIS